jgi:hypothetical protein
MGCNQGPIVARHRIKGRKMRAVALSFAMALCGCGGNANVQANSSGGSAASVNFPGPSRFTALLSAIFLAGVSYESDRAVLLHSAPVPELDPSRRIAEHDCTRPIEDWSANLKCR